VSLSVVKAIVEALDRVIDQLKQVEQQNRARVPESAEGQPQKEQSGNADDSAGTNDAT
jgi:hypothetical protein